MAAIPITTRFRQSCDLINRTPADRFPRLLQRIASRLGDTSDEATFKPEEQAQLREMFGLSEAELSTILEACAYIFEQAAYTTLRPQVLKSTLQEAGMDEAHAESMQQVWAAEAAGLVAKLRERTMGGPKNLVNSHWRMNLMMGEGRLSQMKQPTALFEFGLARPDVASDPSEEKIVAEFAHDELYSFFLDLEKIQEQLDALS